MSDEYNPYPENAAAMKRMDSAMPTPTQRENDEAMARATGQDPDKPAETPPTVQEQIAAETEREVERSAADREREAEQETPPEGVYTTRALKPKRP